MNNLERHIARMLKSNLMRNQLIFYDPYSLRKNCCKKVVVFNLNCFGVSCIVTLLFDFSVSVGAFVVGLSQISSFSFGT